ncbi:ester cyclase [Nocardia harenae]|uniref:ester cyclase n=1 Tax=Nocardia harenae TaxID=358707 RepID=UPI00082B39CD|nr:ester cyclase [Nocardia harenae]
MVTSTDYRALALRSIEIMATGAEADFHAVLHPEATNREAIDEPPACRVPGPSGFYATALWLRAAYSDLRWEVHEVVADGDLVVVRTTMSGRHTGPFVTYDAEGEVEQAFPPTGKTFATTQTHWLRIADELVIEHWANRDDLGTAKQLAWVPPTPAYLVRMARATRAARRAARRDAR